MNEIVINPAYSPLEDVPPHVRFVLLQGGAGSGKSHRCAQKAIELAITKKNVSVLAFRKVGRWAKVSIFNDVRKILNQTFNTDILSLFKITTSPLEVTFKPTNSTIYFLGLDEPEKLKSISDPCWAWMEEATEFTIDDIEQVDLRLRVPGGPNQIWMSFNPISKANYLYKHFYEGSSYDDISFKMKTTWRDNRKYLDAAYINRLENYQKTNPRKYTVYQAGDWASAMEGLVFDDYNIVKNMPEVDQYYYGLDFGFNDPMALVRLAVVDQVAYYDCIYYESEKVVNDDFFDFLRSNGIDRSTAIFCDSSRPEDIERLHRAGFRGATKTKKGPGSIKTGIDLMKQYGVNVYEKSSPMIHELNNYIWAKDRKTGDLLEVPIDDENHSIDAARYALMGYDEMRGKKYGRPSFQRSGSAGYHKKLY